mgnify:CR=1 FL=1
MKGCRWWQHGYEQWPNGWVALPTARMIRWPSVWPKGRSAARSGAAFMTTQATDRAPPRPGQGQGVIRLRYWARWHQDMLCRPHCSVPQCSYWRTARVGSRFAVGAWIRLRPRARRASFRRRSARDARGFAGFQGARRLGQPTLGGAANAARDGQEWRGFLWSAGRRLRHSAEVTQAGCPQQPSSARSQTRTRHRY